MLGFMGLNKDCKIEIYCECGRKFPSEQLYICYK